jgi:hypothetical protein
MNGIDTSPERPASLISGTEVETLITGYIDMSPIDHD